jgi:hypothetical protein
VYSHKLYESLIYVKLKNTQKELSCPPPKPSKVNMYSNRPEVKHNTWNRPQAKATKPQLVPAFQKMEHVTVTDAKEWNSGCNQPKMQDRLFRSSLFTSKPENTLKPVSQDKPPVWTVRGCGEYTDSESETEISAINESTKNGKPKHDDEIINQPEIGTTNDSSAEHIGAAEEEEGSSAYVTPSVSPDLNKENIPPVSRVELKTIVPLTKERQEKLNKLRTIVQTICSMRHPNSVSVSDIVSVLHVAEPLTEDMVGFCGLKICAFLDTIPGLTTIAVSDTIAYCLCDGTTA